MAGKIPSIPGDLKVSKLFSAQTILFFVIISEGTYSRLFPTSWKLVAFVHAGKCMLTKSFSDCSLHTIHSPPRDSGVLG